MPNYNDIRDFIENKKLAHAEVARRQQKQVVEVGRQLQMVVDHPAWQVYVDHLMAMKEAAEKERDGVILQLAEGDDLSEVSKQKMHLKLVIGKIAGYTDALSLIPELVKRAADAAAQM